VGPKNQGSTPLADDMLRGRVLTPPNNIVTSLCSGALAFVAAAGKVLLYSDNAALLPPSCLQRQLQRT